MRYGISAGAIVMDENDRILLVHHFEEDNFDFWVPPGGKLEGKESIFDCAKREVFEETGLHVELSEILYIQEFCEPDYHFCKFFIAGKVSKGELSIFNKDEDEGWLVDVRFFSQNELNELTVYPEILKGKFWLDRKAGELKTIYLGLEEMKF